MTDYIAAYVDDLNPTDVRLVEVPAGATSLEAITAHASTARGADVSVLDVTEVGKIEVLPSTFAAYGVPSGHLAPTLWLDTFATLDEAERAIRSYVERGRPASYPEEA